ncbi:MAG: indolepyruvate oxidoreductase subunit beta [Clostridiaceae bacterium]|nr:indolepyruvate oxidoreductase subunit beta [Clostridiaceae bacterium]
MIKQLNLVLAGVGGQGTLVAGKLLGLVAGRLGLDVKVSEVHGMSQRGGSVVTYVRMGSRVFSPIVEAGTADIILAFEELEALRWAPLLREGGVLLINTTRTIPLTVAMGQAQYPENILEQLRQAAGDKAVIEAFDGARLAREAGSARAVNMVMIGAMSRYLDLPAELFLTAIDQVFAEKLRPANHKAFQAGSAIIESKNPA